MTGRGRPLLAAFAAALISLGAVGGCTAGSTGRGTPAASPGGWDGRSCLPAVTSATGPGRPASPAGDDTALPDLLLACVSGGQTRLAELTGPAIINLWASWCRPCQVELPEFQRYHERVAPGVAVIGVVTRDDRAAAESTIADRSLTFPMVWDPDGALLRGTGQLALPVTLFVSDQGRVVHTYHGPALRGPQLEELARTRLGVRVGS